jgi:hypothetical protein
MGSWNFKQPVVVWLIWAMALIAYILPWVNSHSSALAFNGYDLAEWSRLHPALEHAFDPLAIALLLRLPLICLAWIAVCLIPNRRWWIALGIIVIFSIALQPPIEFYTRFRDDPNYQQLASLSILTFIAGLFILNLRKLQLYLLVGLTVISVCVLITAIWQSTRLVANSIPNSTLGTGAILSIACMMCIGVLSGIMWKKTNRAAFHYPVK